MIQSVMSQLNIDKIVLLPPDRIVDPRSWVGHIPFAFAITQCLKPKTIVELGVYSGNSYNSFCQAVQFLNLDTKCYGVDTWVGDDHAGYYPEQVFIDLTNYQQRYNSFSSLLRMPFDQAVNNFQDASIDLLHIDGCHTYDSAKHDYETWLPKMSDKGVILFHDTCVCQGSFGVNKLWNELRDQYSSFNFIHFYGLGVLLVGLNQHEDVWLFLNSLKTTPFFREFFECLGNSLGI